MELLDVDAVEQIDLPGGIEWEIGGARESDIEKLQMIMNGLFVSIAVIFFILLFHFRRINMALLILGSLALCLLGAGVGIWGQQAIPTVISMLFFWPVLITQIWGMVEQSKLDDKALDIARDVIYMSNAKSAGSNAGSNHKFCTNCGTENSETAKFCNECGKLL